MGLTKKQQMALDVKDRTLLLSAGAGSGKTSTLIARIIETLTDGKNPSNITELLIVTFTNAAVAEIKSRVEKALNAAIAENPKDTHLQKQLQLLPAANIMTIDSLCQEFLKKNAEALGLLPNYRVADTAEASLLASDVMDRVLTGFYEGAYADTVSEKDFLSLTDMLVGVKGAEKGIGDVLISLYDKIDNREKGVLVLSDYADKFPAAKTPEETPFGAYAVARVRELSGMLLPSYQKRLRSLDPKHKKEGAWLPRLEAECAFLTRLQKAQTYAEMREEYLSYHEEGKAPVVTTATATENEFLAKNLRDSLFKTVFDDNLAAVFACSETDFMTLYDKTRDAAKTTFSVLSAFDTAFRAEKKRLGVCEYNDLERYFYESLWKDGKRTPTADMMRSQYRMIFIDEYQDISPIQHKIFEALAKDDNRFMVGDIKQSIYGFRSADPTIFAAMKQAFPLCDPDARDKASTIFMSENFRCDEGIVRTVNEIFNVLFGAVAAGIGYNQAEEEMIYQKENKYNAPLRKTELLIAQRKETVKKGATEEEKALAESLGGAEAEARLMAKKVKELLGEKKDDGTPITYGDIVVLLRNATHMQSMVDIFEQNGVPCRGQCDKDFFKNPSVLLALALLNTIDNPYRDIYLCGTLMSPLFDFTPDEMAAIRHQKNDEPLYVSLVSYVEEHPDFQKGRKFLDTLGLYRAMCVGGKLEDLLFRLYHETGLLSLAVRNHGDDNLWVLYENARKFERSSYQGLGAFLRYVTRILDKRGKFDTPDSNTPAENAVRFMTIHASKGLEFPVVFVPECGAGISDKDAREPVLFSDEMGFACNLYDETGNVRLDTPMRNVVKMMAKRKLLDEEMRIFYVALTRAAERLYLFASTSDKESEWSSKLSVAAAREDKNFAVLTATSYLSWTMLSAKNTVSYQYVPLSETAEPTNESSEASEDEPITPSPKEDAPVDQALADTLEKRFSFEYPDKSTLGVPEKLSVSKLYPTVLDGTDGESADSLEAHFEEPKHKEPRFLSGVIEDEAAKRGIATHAFLQFCDFEKLSLSGGVAELSRLAEKRFLSKEDAALVRMEEIEKFCASALCGQMRAAKRLYRELRFHVRLPAENFTADEEKKKSLRGKKLLVQGVMDCVMENADGTLTLIDYKTDRLPSFALENPKAAATILREKHEKQLSYYKEAVKQIFGKYPERTVIYSLHMGISVDL